MGLGQTTSGPQGSLVFRQAFKQVIAEDKVLSNNFLNYLFNNLNAAITEFGVVMKDVCSFERRSCGTTNFDIR